jgi:hypothetical protein
METKKDIKQKIREGLHNREKYTVVSGILNNCAENMNNAFRELSNALQYVEDGALRKELEDIKSLISHDIQTNKAFANSAPTIMSRLKDILNARKTDNGSDMYTE